MKKYSAGQYGQEMETDLKEYHIYRTERSDFTDTVVDPVTGESYALSHFDTLRNEMMKIH